MRSRLFLAVVLLPLLSLTAVLAEELAEPHAGLIGDESDGSRAHPTHLIPLFAENEDGEKGGQITLDADPLLPISTKYTCGECHSYDVIKQGWHFNAIDENVPPGRPGEPWIYADAKLGIQVPLSYRPWAGTIQPREFGLSEFAFTRLFGRHMPGGGPGEVTATDDADIGRQYISGKLEINCLACHNGHYGQDMGGVEGWAVQIAVRQNNRWAAAASCEFASVKGSAAAMSIAYDPFMPEGDDKEPRVVYREEAFDADHNVLFDILREVPNQRCYYCHSDVYFSGGEEKTEKWSSEEDVHLKAGLTCVDCHRNDIHHEIVRGYPGESEESGNPLVATMTCEGCHLPQGPDVPQAGRLGAPIPQHVGLPPVHFERLSCTACHSGPWPSDRAVFTKTARAHRLGTPNVNKSEQMLPHILSPVFAHDGDKISPHKMLWPAYWGRRAGDEVTPIALDVVEKTVRAVFDQLEIPASGTWPGIAKEQIATALQALSKAADANAVYVAGGTLYSLNEAGDVEEQADHPVAKPYMWPLAHTVRPAAQSLGIRYCTDCHATDAPFFFGTVAVDSPIASDVPTTRQMVGFQNISRFYAWAFSASFVFRPWFKVVALGASAVLGIVLLLYGLKALGAVARVLAEDE
ncbi:hypothetical protein [Anaerobaca lacustris]|uniref:Multiheme c-type cytochrome n=1 Tax=Anaerobaca lacustris TaxID=3044600 RepID=A0AAW6TX21_9BACT|nr:multiheme c-type cytochrome [Sedimentisphaerales bacterium M17dextr]